MTQEPAGVGPPFRWATRLIVAGLVVELLSLFRLHHPLGFMFFMAFGFTLTGAGVLIFIYHMLQIVRLSRPGASK